jgi:hypothetical protein
MYENDDEETLGIKGIPSGNLPAGVGYVIIPNNVDIRTYKEDVYRSGRISIYGGYGHSNFYNVLIDREVLQRIKFPSKVGEFGSPVVWINIPKHNEPIVISCLKYDEDFHSVSEFRSRTTRGNDGNLVDFDLDGKKGKATLNIVGNANSNGELEITINSIKGKGLLKLIVNGKILEKSSDSVIRISEKEMISAVTNKKGITLAKLELHSENPERLYYEDEFGNKMTASKEKFNFRSDTSKKIDFGDGAEPLVLAKTLKSILDEYDDALSKMTVPTAFGPSGTRINDSEFKAVRAKFEQFFSKLTNSD